MKKHPSLYLHDSETPGTSTSSDPSPRLSVTVLNYNCAPYLRECLDSILAQTYTNFEVILINDCSTDDSLQIIQPYLADPRVRLVNHQVNKGFARSLIDGTELHSRGELLTVVSGDDAVARRDAFERQIAMFEADQEIALCFSSYARFYSGTGETFEVQRSFDGDAVLDGYTFANRYLTDMRVQVLHTGSMFRRSAYLACGGYRRDGLYALDFALWPALAMVGKVAYCEQTLYRYRCQESQMSHHRAGVEASIREILTAIDATYTNAKQHGVETSGARIAAIKCSLFAVALDDAFADRPRLALLRSLAALRYKPGYALTSRGLWIVLARVILGQRLFELTRNLAGKAGVARRSSYA